MAIDQNIVQHLAEDGHVITNKEVSDIAKAEAADTGNPCPVSGGLAATAQSIHDKQQNFLQKEAELEKKSESDITKDDAKEIQSAEARLLGFRPPPGSLSAHIQSVADKNDNDHQREPTTIDDKKVDQHQEQKDDAVPQQEEPSGLKQDADGR